MIAASSSKPIENPNGHYTYGLDSQLSFATVGGATEEFLWDGLALVRRGATGYLKEPHANGGSPILASKFLRPF